MWMGRRSTRRLSQLRPLKDRDFDMAVKHHVID
jgi:hypothetical protein